MAIISWIPQDSLTSLSSIFHDDGVKNQPEQLSAAEAQNAFRCIHKLTVSIQTDDYRTIIDTATNSPVFSCNPTTLALGNLADKIDTVTLIPGQSLESILIEKTPFNSMSLRKKFFARELVYYYIYPLNFYLHLAEITALLRGIEEFRIERKLRGKERIKALLRAFFFVHRPNKIPGEVPVTSLEPFRFTPIYNERKVNVGGIEGKQAWSIVGTLNKYANIAANLFVRTPPIFHWIEVTLLANGCKLFVIRDLSAYPKHSIYIENDLWKNTNPDFLLFQLVDANFNPWTNPESYKTLKSDRLHSAYGFDHFTVSSNDEKTWCNNVFQEHILSTVHDTDLNANAKKIVETN
jgi:hypothetical protein